MADNAPGKHYRKRIGIMDIVRMFNTEQKACDWLACYVWSNMSILRVVQRTVWNQASTDDTPLPGLPKEENVYAQNRYDHVALKAGLSDLGDCRVPDCYQSERHIQYEAPP